jgi:putative oxidoreductase
MLLTNANAQPRGGGVIVKLIRRYTAVFASLEKFLDGWFLELGARFMFAASLMMYYLNSVTTKLGDGLLGVFSPTAGAFAQILPPVAEEYLYDTAAIPFMPWHLIVISGSIAEMLLPILIVLGLFTRLSALAMIGFIVVQTSVDILFHSVAAGSWFDNQATDLIDERAFWIFPLVLLVVKGGGALSADTLLRRYRQRRFE